MPTPPVEHMSYGDIFLYVAMAISLLLNLLLGVKSLAGGGGTLQVAKETRAVAEKTYQIANTLHESDLVRKEAQKNHDVQQRELRDAVLGIATSINSLVAEMKANRRGSDGQAG